MILNFIRHQIPAWLLWVAFALLGLACIAVPMMLEAAQAIGLYNKVGYYSLLVTCLLLGYFGIGCLRGRVRQIRLLRKDGRFPWSRRLCFAGLTVLVVFAFFVQRQEAGFKTVMDEHLIAASAKRMHENRTPDMAYRYMNLQGKPTVIVSFLDKRPHAFPFLVSALHDVTGYRVANPFLANRLLLLVFLCALGYWAYQVGGLSATGFALATLVTSPLLVYNAASGGLEMMFLALILTQLLVMAAVLKDPSMARIGALCMVTILLAQTRYEGILFLLPCGLVILEAIARRGWKIPWPVWIAPLLLVPYLLRHRVFELGEDAFQMQEIAGTQDPFSMSFIPDNFSRWLVWLLRFDYDVPNSPFIGIVGTVCLIVLLVVGLRRLDRLRQNPLLRATAYSWFGCGLLLLMLLAYGWPIDGAVTRRLALPCLLPLIMAMPLVFFRLLRDPVRHRLPWAVWFVFFISVSLPTLNKGHSAGYEQAKVEFELAEEILAELDDPRAIIVAENRSFFYIHEQPTAGVEMFEKRLQQTKNFLAIKNRPPLYLFTREVWNPQTKSFDLSSRVQVDRSQVTLEQQRTSTYTEAWRVVLYEIVDIPGYEATIPAFTDLREYVEF